MNLSTYTDAGRQRETNEDAVLSTELDAIDGYLLAVADGMGGHQAGELASHVAITELREVVTRALTDPPIDLRTILAKAFEKAHDEIRTLARDHPEYGGMGTTLVAAVITDGEMLIGNVGDSRAYRLTENAIYQVTDDHSLVQELVDEGTITAEEAAEHPQRNVVTQAIGTQSEIDPDLFPRTPAETWGLDDDVLLLCSDGLSEEVDDRIIHATVTQASTLDTAGAKLIEKAKQAGGRDNISVILAATE